MNVKNRMKLFTTSLPKNVRESMKKTLLFLMSFALALFKTTSILLPCFGVSNHVELEAS